MKQHGAVESAAWGASSSPTMQLHCLYLQCQLKEWETVMGLVQVGAPKSKEKCD